MNKENSELTIALEEHRKYQKVWEAYELGSEEDIEFIKEVIVNDPYRHLRSLDHV